MIVVPSGTVTSRPSIVSDTFLVIAGVIVVVAIRTSTIPHDWFEVHKSV